MTGLLARRATYVVLRDLLERKNIINITLVSI